MFEKLLVLFLALFTLALASEPPFTSYHQPSPVFAAQKIAAAGGVKKAAEKCVYTTVETGPHTVSIHAVCTFT